MIKLRNTLYGTRPVVLHCPSSEVQHNLWDRAVALMMRDNQKCRQPDDLSIITWNNMELDGFFEISAKKNGLKYEVLGKGLMPWNNRNKIALTREFAATCQNNYILGVDSFDAILTGDPARTVDALRASGAEMIFNGSIMSYPSVEEFSEYEKSINDSVFCHLNAGVWVATTAFCREFFEFAFNYEDDEKTGKFPMSEQVIIRATLPHFKGRVKIDGGCEIFQTIEFPNLYPPDHADTQYIELGVNKLLIL